MRPDWKQIAGCAALGTLLALSGPGVRAVRADGPVSALPAAPACEAGPAVHQGTVDALLDQIQDEHVRRMGQAPPGGMPEIVVLNNQGYNYRNEAGPDVGAIQNELLRVRSEQQKQE